MARYCDKDVFCLDARLTGRDWMSIKHGVPSPIDGEFLVQQRAERSSNNGNEE